MWPIMLCVTKNFPMVSCAVFFQLFFFYWGVLYIKSQMWGFFYKGRILMLFPYTVILVRYCCQPQSLSLITFNQTGIIYVVYCYLPGFYKQSFWNHWGEYMIRMKINVRQMEKKPRRLNLLIHILGIPRKINRAHRNKAICRKIIERKMFS